MNKLMALPEAIFCAVPPLQSPSEQVAGGLKRRVVVKASIYRLYQTIQQDYASIAKLCAFQCERGRKRAWHLGHRIRAVWSAGGDLLAGPVEVDETYVGGKAPIQLASATASQASN